MRWLRVMAAALVLLIAANIFVLVKLEKLYSETNIISDEVIEDTVTLLNQSGVEINADAIPKEKSDCRIYECEFFTDREAYYRSAASIMLEIGEEVSDDEAFTLYLTADGIRIAVEGCESVIEFFDEGVSSFMYCRDGSVEQEEELCRTIVESGISVKAEDKEVKNCVKNFRTLTGFSAVGDAVDTICTAAYRSEDGKYLLAELSQSVDGIEIDGMKGSCLVCDGEIIYIVGSFLFHSEYSAYSTELYDQVNVLFDERDSLNGKNAVITSVKSVYTVSHIQGEDKLYIVPAWKITYTRTSDNGEEISEYYDIRDMLDGSLISSYGTSESLTDEKVDLG